MNWNIDGLQDAWMLAARLHDGQKYGGNVPDEQVEYLNHIGSVTGTNCPSLFSPTG